MTFGEFTGSVLTGGWRPPLPGIDAIVGVSCGNSGKVDWARNVQSQHAIRPGHLVLDRRRSPTRLGKDSRKPIVVLAFAACIGCSAMPSDADADLLFGAAAKGDVAAARETRGPRIFLLPSGAEASVAEAVEIVERTPFGTSGPTYALRHADGQGESTSGVAGVVAAFRGDAATIARLLGKAVLRQEGALGLGPLGLATAAVLVLDRPVREWLDELADLPCVRYESNGKSLDGCWSASVPLPQTWMEGAYERVDQSFESCAPTPHSADACMASALPTVIAAVQNERDWDFLVTVGPSVDLEQLGDQVPGFAPQPLVRQGNIAGRLWKRTDELPRAASSPGVPGARRVGYAAVIDHEGHEFGVGIYALPGGLRQVAWSKQSGDATDPVIAAALRTIRATFGTGGLPQEQAVIVATEPTGASVQTTGVGLVGVVSWLVKHDPRARSIRELFGSESTADPSQVLRARNALIDGLDAALHHYMTNAPTLRESFASAEKERRLYDAVRNLPADRVVKLGGDLVVILKRELHQLGIHTEFGTLPGLDGRERFALTLAGAPDTLDWLNRQAREVGASAIVLDPVGPMVLGGHVAHAVSYGDLPTLGLPAILQAVVGNLSAALHELVHVLTAKGQYPAFSITIESSGEKFRLDEVLAYLVTVRYLDVMIRHSRLEDSLFSLASLLQEYTVNYGIYRTLSYQILQGFTNTLIPLLDELASVPESQIPAKLGEHGLSIDLERGVVVFPGNERLYMKFQNGRAVSSVAHAVVNGLRALDELPEPSALESPRSH